LALKLGVTLSLLPSADLILLSLELHWAGEGICCDGWGKPPPSFSLEPAASLVEVSATLIACCSLTSSISMKASISWPLSICGRV
jgi:hypothetical protein